MQVQSVPVLAAVSACVRAEASNEGYPKVREDFSITEKAPTSSYNLPVPDDLCVCVPISCLLTVGLC